MCHEDGLGWSSCCMMSCMMFVGLLNFDKNQYINGRFTLIVKDIIRRGKDKRVIL